VSLAVSLCLPLDAARAADVHGDNEADRYVGTGALLLPRSVGSGTRREVAECASCEWRMTTPCIASSAGVAFPGQSVCDTPIGGLRGCPGVSERLRVWFRPSDGTWRLIGLVCIQASGPVTIADLGARARERFASDLPPLVLAAQPAQGVLAQIPVVFASGQPGEPMAASYPILGETVTVRAQPTWTWQFGDGATLATSDPGGTYPHLAVAHAYRRSGDFSVAVNTSWAAQFTVDDLGPFPIPEPVTQDRGIRVRVGEGRAVLAVP
jgi:hypothetical protein